MTETKTVDQYIIESMMYERAQSTASAIMNDLAAKRNENERYCKQSGDVPDGSFQLVIDALSKAKKGYAKESNRLWKLAEKNAEIYEPGVENLCNAIIQKAAEDYESALCGGGSESEKLRIEKFAEHGADSYTGLDFRDILSRIRDAKPKFSKVVQEHAQEIINETNANRKNDGDNRNNKYRCPLCGSGLFAYGKKVAGMQQIRCTGCAFWEGVNV